MELISLFGAGLKLASTIAAGEHAQRVMDQLQRQSRAIMQLSNNLFYLQRYVALRDLSLPTQRAADVAPEAYREAADELPPDAGSPIAVTGAIETPLPLTEAMGKDPWAVLDDVRPVSRARIHRNPEMMPLLFADQRQKYLGWQTRGVLESVFGLRYEPLADSGHGEHVAPQRSNLPPDLIPTISPLVRLEIVRHNAWVAMLLGFNLVVNDLSIGTLRAGEWKTFDVPPGDLVIYIDGGFQGVSKPIRLTAAPGDVVKLECAASWKTWAPISLSVRR